MTCRSAFVLVIVWLFPVSTAGADALSMDLAQPPGTTTTVTVDPGTYTVIVSNTLQGDLGHYDRSVIRRNQTIPTFDVPEGALRPEMHAAAANTCSQAEDSLRTQVRAATDESIVAGVISGAQKTLARKGIGCTAKQINDFVAELKAASTFSFPVTIRGGEDVTITVSRKGASADEKLVWTLHLDTKPRGTWLTTYGAAIIPDRNELFWLTPTATSSKFVVARQHQGKNELIYLPAIFFTWLPGERELLPATIGPTVGLGAGTSGFSMFLGLSWLYNWNLQVSAGASAFQVKRLAGAYAVGDTVGTNLTEDQLHRTTIWPGWYAAITLRFGGNPFKSASAESTSAAPSKGGE